MSHIIPYLTIKQVKATLNPWRNLSNTTVVTNPPQPSWCENMVFGACTGLWKLTNKSTLGCCKGLYEKNKLFLTLKHGHLFWKDEIKVDLKVSKILDQKGTLQALWLHSGQHNHYTIVSCNLHDNQWHHWDDKCKGWPPHSDARTHTHTHTKSIWSIWC